VGCGVSGLLGVFVFIWILAFKINKILEKEG